LAFIDTVAIAVTYAARFPDRVSHLILVDGWASFSDVAATPTFQAHEALIDSDWTVLTETMARVLVGMDDPQLIDGLGEYIRACIEPEAYRAFMEAVQTWDVADLLPNVKAQTLVLHNNDARFAPIRAGQKLAASIAAARFLAIDDMNYERVPALVEEFVMGSEPTRVSQRAGDTHTILFTDMEGSTTLADQLGDAAAQEVRRAHNDIVRAALTSNSGNEIKHTGDGIMASFATASAALDAAIAIQRGVAAHKDENPVSPLAVYVGLNAGEPIAEEDDLFGTSINLAARICDHAEAGQIVAADVVRQLAAGKDFLFSDLGETELRGFEDPVKLWELRWQEQT
jgi:class 3 adenylate cyclase